jgi:hypothetical protein
VIDKDYDEVYKKICDEIILGCKELNFKFQKKNQDGRIDSIIDEDKYLNGLKDILKTKNPMCKIDIRKARFWYDIRIQNIPINLKLTSGGTDNAFNKKAILYSLSGEEIFSASMSVNEFFDMLYLIKKKQKGT